MSTVAGKRGLFVAVNQGLVDFFADRRAGESAGSAAFRHHHHGVTRGFKGSVGRKPSDFIIAIPAVFDFRSAGFAAHLVAFNAGTFACAVIIGNIRTHGLLQHGEVLGAGEQFAANPGTGELLCDFAGAGSLHAVNQARVVECAAIGNRSGGQSHLQGGHGDGALADGNVGRITVSPSFALGVGQSGKLAGCFLTGQEAGFFSEKKLLPHLDDLLDAIAIDQRVLDEISVAGFFKGATKIVMARRCGILDSPPANDGNAGGILLFGRVQAVFQRRQAGDDLENGTGRITFLCGAVNERAGAGIEVAVPLFVANARGKSV